MYSRITFANKSRKRALEDRLTDIKIAYTHQYSVGSAISLTGPAMEPHLFNYTRLGVNNVFIAENDYKTIHEMRKYQPIVGHVPYKLHQRDVASLFKQLCKSGECFTDIDLDFTATPTTVLPTVKDILTTMGNYPKSLTFHSTLIVTFCQRNTKRKSAMSGYREILNILNNSESVNVQRVYYQSYKEGAPMATAMYLLRNITTPLLTKPFNGEFENIDSVLITKGKRQFP